MTNSIFFILIVFGMWVVSIEGLETDHWGTQFIFSFTYPIHYDSKNIIAITARETTNVRVTFQETQSVVKLRVQAGQSNHTWLNYQSLAYPFGLVLQRKAVSVEASAKVSVYAYSYAVLNQTSDGMLVLPVASLGTRYLVMNMNIPNNAQNQIVIVATEDNTNITVTFRGNYQCNKNGFITFPVQENLTMDAYDVVNYLCNSDTSGTLITSSKPIAVITGSRQLQLYNDFHRGQVMEMLPPTTEFGTEYAFVTPHGHTGGTRVRIISEFTWQATILNNVQGSIPRQPLDLFLNQKIYLCFTTNQPVLVVVFMTASLNFYGPTDTGNAYMMVIPPVTKFSNHYVIPMDIFGQNGFLNYKNRIDVIAKLPISGPVSPSVTYTNMCPGFVTSSSDGSLSGTIEFTTNSPFIVLVYGFIHRDGFGFPGGMKLTDFSGTEECSSSPCINDGWCIETALSYKCHCSDTRYTGQHCETDTVNDCDPNPCLNGICNDLSGFYTCSCDAGYTGFHCFTALETTTQEQTTLDTTTQEQTTLDTTTQEQTTIDTTTQEQTTLDTTTQEQTTLETTTQEQTTLDTTTQEQTTLESTTQEQTTLDTTTQEQTTLDTTTQEQTTIDTTTQEQTTLDTTTQEQTTTLETTIQEQTTLDTTTQEQTTLETTTQEQTTLDTTTQEQTTLETTTQEQTTLETTTQEQTTLDTTTQEQTTLDTTTQEQTTLETTTLDTTTHEQTTQEQTTLDTTTQEQTTPETTTQEQTTLITTTQEQTTLITTTQEQTTLDTTTQEQTTLDTTTQDQTTLDTTTQEQTTLESTTQEQTTLETTAQEQTTLETTTQEQTTLDTTTQEQTTLETTTQEQTTLDTTTQEQTTTLDTTTQEQTTLDTTTQEQTTTLETTIQEQTTLDTTTQEQTTLETTTQEQTTLDTTTQEQTTLETTTQEQTTLDSTTQEQTTLDTTTQEQTTLDTTTQEQTTPITSLATTLSFIPTRIYMRKQFCNGELCICKCPCVKKVTAAQMKENAIQTINVLKVEESTLSKTVRKKISSENLTQSETNLGATAVIFVTSVLGAIIFMDISKVISWISNKSRKRTNIIRVDPENETDSPEK